MEKVKRAELLRERFSKVVGVFAFQKPRTPIPKRYVPTRTPFRFVYPMGFSGGRGFVGKWVVTPEETPKQTVSAKHRKGVPAVTAIAAKAPKKLLRTYRTAEGLLEAHARR